MNILFQTGVALLIFELTVMIANEVIKGIYSISISGMCVVHDDQWQAACSMCLGLFCGEVAHLVLFGQSDELSIS